MAAVVEDAAQRDVVEIVARGLRERAVLAPAGEAAEHQARIAGEAHVGTEAEALHHAGAEALDQPVALLDEPQHHLDRTRLLEVDRDRALAAAREVVLRLGIERQRAALAVHQHDLGAEVGEQHAAERPGADAGELEDADAGEWTHGE